MPLPLSVMHGSPLAVPTVDFANPHTRDAIESVTGLGDTERLGRTNKDALGADGEEGVSMLDLVSHGAHAWSTFDYSGISARSFIPRTLSPVPTRFLR